MYTAFFNLREKPFSLSPSSRFLYLGEVHKEALALLQYGLSERKGFVLLTGEVGTGKTTMLQVLLSRLGDNVQVVYLSNPVLSREDFISYLTLSTFKRKNPFQSKAEFLIEFEAFLKDCLARQRVFLLIVDEAQKLSLTLLEEIRLLSNMETSDEKLFNIFLVGQPELNELLSRSECRPLLQRIGIRYHMRPLSLEATRQYIQRRLQLAGAEEGSEIFPPKTVQSVYTYSGGYPRLINVLADNALLLGYARKKKIISPEMIQQCHLDMRPQGDREGVGGEGDEGETGARPPRRFFREAAALGVLLLAAAALVLFGNKDLLPRVISFGSNLRQVERNRVYSEKISPLEGEVEGLQEEAPTNSSFAEVDPPPSLSPAVPNGGPEPPSAEPVLPVESTEKEEGGGGLALTVKEGDTLTGLVLSVYGRSDLSLLDRVQRANPSISDMDRIEAGQVILFPSLSKLSE